MNLSSNLVDWCLGPHFAYTFAFCPETSSKDCVMNFKTFEKVKYQKALRSLWEVTASLRFLYSLSWSPTIRTHPGWPQKSRLWTVSLSESPKLPQIYFPVSERSSEALMDERVMMERQSERPSQDSNECSKVPSRRISIHSTESAKNAMKSRRSLSTAKLEIENPVQSYSISGINRKDEKLFRVFGGVLWFYGINHARPLITHDLQWHWRYLEFIKMEALDATSAWVLLFAASLCHLGWCIIKPCNFWIYSLMDSSTWRSVLAINMYLKYQFSCYTEDCIVLPYELLWEVTSIYEIY